MEPPARNSEFERITQAQVDAIARTTPYHSLELLDGTVVPGVIPVENLRARLDACGLPADLSGKRVLDIGAASGWNSFECERRGASVVAVDCVEYDELVRVKKLRQSSVDYVIADMEELTPERLGTFDIVLFFGVLYHLRHPLLGLERVCALSRERAFIESFVIDAEPAPSRCYVEFYETDELGGQLDNWYGPTTQCLISMVRAAGFARVDLKYVESRRGGLVAWRTWQPASPITGAPRPFLRSAVNNRHNDNVFQPGKDEYLSLVFDLDEPLTKDDIMVEVGEFGVQSLSAIRHAAGYWQANARMPPGISPGEHRVRIGTARGGFSDSVTIGMLPSDADRQSAAAPFAAADETVSSPVLLKLENTMDGGNLFRGYREETLACRFTHSDERLRTSNVQITVDADPYPLLSVEEAQPGVWQVNARIKDVPSGEHALRLRTAHSGFSEPLLFVVEAADWVHLA